MGATPGPWTVVSYGSGVALYIIASNGMSVAAVYRMERLNEHGVSNRIKDGEEDAANARLIAEAPDLLSIAKRWAALDGGSWQGDRHACEKAELLADTRTAIAKTESA